MESRRQYISDIRASFKDTEEKLPAFDKYYFRKTEEGGIQKQVVGVGVWFKFRLFCAVIVFLAFLLCDFNGTSFYGVSTEKMEELVEENYDYTNLKKYVMIFSDLNVLPQADSD